MNKKIKISFFILALQISSFLYGTEHIKKNSPELKEKATALMGATHQLGFQENKGQMIDTEGKPAHDVLFKAEAHGLNIWVTNSGLTYQFLKFEEHEDSESKSSFVETSEDAMSWHRVDMILKNAEIKKENVITEGAIPQGVENFYLAHCPNGIFDVKTFTKITIKNIYKGIDWVLYTNNGFAGSSLKYDFIVHPNADANQIKLIYEGSGRMEVQNNQIHFENTIGELDEGKLFCYQENESNEVSSKYVIKKNQSSVGRLTSDVRQVETFSYEINIQLNNYDKSKQLTIDPQLVWSTFYGGNAADGAMSIDCDAAGNIFIVSYIHSVNYPVLNPGGGAYYQPTLGAGTTVANVSVIMFSNTGTRVWATYYGGSGHDVGTSVCVDNNGNVFVTGYAQSSDFPLQSMPGAYYQGVIGGHYDVFVLEFNNTGIRLWGTFYGALNTDYGHSICVGSSGDIYVTGFTNSPAFPTLTSGAFFQGAYGGNSAALGGDAFILKFSNAGVLRWATFCGGSGDDAANAICADANGNVFLTGYTKSANFPIASPGGSYSQAFGGVMDAFVLKFSNTETLTWGTFYGGVTDETGHSIACDNTNAVYVLGQTNSNNMPVLNFPGAFNQAANAGGEDAFILKFTNAGARTWATYYGSADTEWPSSWDNIAIDACDNVYVSFTVTGPNLPVKNYTSCNTNYFNPTYNPKSDCYIAKFKNDCSLMWSTYFGGDGGDFREAMAVDNSDNLFIVGEWANVTNTASCPLVNPGGGAYYSSTFMGSDDTYISKFSPPVLTFTQAQTPNTSCSPCNGSATITVNCGNANYNYIWSNSSQTLNDTSNTNTISGLCAGTYTVTVTSNCNRTITATFTITGVPAVVTTTNNQTICTGNTYTLPGGGIVSASGAYSDTLLSSNGCDSIITTNLTVSPAITSTQNPSICTGSSFTLPDGSTATATGIFVDTVQTGSGCDSIITTNLTVSTSINITQNPVICTGQSFTLPDGSQATTSLTQVDTLPAIGGCDSIITTNVTVSPALTTSQNPSICTGQSFTLPDGSIVNTSGIYTDTLQTSSGCDSIITTTLTVSAVLTSSQNPIICTGNNFSLPGGGTANTTGTYYDTLTTTSGCDSIITTNLTVKPNSIINQSPVLCAGESYPLPDGTQATTTGVYIDTLASANGCDSIITINLTVNPTPLVSISPDITIIQGDSTTLFASGGGTYNWAPSNGLNTTTGTTVIATPNETTTYCVIVTSSSGCVDSICVTVNVELPCPENENLDAPNAFSPNSDGMNDEYCLQGWTPCTENFLIMIYNRWGEKVFESQDPNFCWDGKYKGKMMDAQVFVYIIKAKYTNIANTIEKQGNISLIK